MAPEHEAQERAFYDHESAAPSRRRRAAADWGVNEDIFDRMPSRFSRVERRAEQHEIVIRHDGETAIATATPERSDGGRRFARNATADARATATWRETGEWTSVELVRGDRTESPTARRETGEWTSIDVSEAGRERVASARRESGARPVVRDQRAAADAARRDPDLDPRAAARAVMSWGEDLDDAPLVPGESRTIVLSRDEYEHAGVATAAIIDDTPRRQTAEFDAVPAEPRERKTVKISGHPDRLPVPRTQRRPRTAVERIGHRPDRIAAYAVALGFLLVLIAVLTTGQ